MKNGLTTFAAPPVIRIIKGNDNMRPNPIDLLIAVSFAMFVLRMRSRKGFVSRADRRFQVRCARYREDSPRYRSTLWEGVQGLIRFESSKTAL